MRRSLVGLQEKVARCAQAALAPRLPRTYHTVVPPPEKVRRDDGAVDQGPVAATHAEVARAGPVGGSGRGAASNVLALQRNVGNRATVAALGSEAPLGRTSRPVIQRLATVERFRERVGRAGKGWVKNSETIARLEELYASIEDRALAPEARLAALEEIKDSAGSWAKVHGKDLGRGDAARWLAAQAVLAGNEIDTLKKRQLKGGNADFKQVTYDRTKSKIVRKAEAPDMNGALAMLATLLDLVCSAPGSKGEVELEVDIPVHPPAFVGFRFKVEGDRPDPEKLKARLELAFTGGAHISGSVGRAAGELGGFSEAQAKNSNEVMTMFSYGLYRRARESSLSVHKLTNALWGGGKTGKEGWDSAEEWASDVETKIMAPNADAYVSSGGFARGAVEMGIEHVGKAQGDLQVGGGKHWDAASINAIANAKSAWSPSKITAVAIAIAKAAPSTAADRRKVADDLAKDKHYVNADKIAEIVRAYLKERKELKIPDSVAWSAAALEVTLADFSYSGKTRLAAGKAQTQTAGAVESRAERLMYFKSSGAVSAGPGMAAAKVEGSWVTRGRDGNIPSHLREAKIEVRGGFVMPTSKLISGGLLEAFDFGRLASGLVAIIRLLNPKDTKLGGAQKVGQAALPITEMTEMGLQIGSVPTETFSTALKESDPLKAGASGSATVQLVIEGKMKGQKPGDASRAKELKISLGEEQALRYEAVVARVKAKTFGRWVQLTLKPGVDKPDGSSAQSEWALDIAGQTSGGKWGGSPPSGG